ncbi:phosphatidate cytidylyltransferase [Elusimicrobium simillimum]|uniref:phosphatidate cytidylyltransferase n=1 Tax=Elusimicrobium simillimum TaxID=3143438 RepID=UPI003C704F27
MLLPRIITAVIGIPLIIAAIHMGGLVYMAFVGCVIALCLYEYGLIMKAGRKPVHLFSLVFFGIIMAAVAIVGRGVVPVALPDNLYPFTISVVILGIMFVEVITPNRSLERVAFTFFGVFFVPWTLAHLINIRDIPTYGEYLTLFMLITVWICDSMAYFVGRAIGKHKMNKEVSPKKSWEGAVGGTLFAVLAAIGLRALFLPTLMTVWQAAVLGLIIAIVGQVSDLSESIIKRSTGVKDSSNLLPGHGGFLDRFDSYLLLAPVFYYTVLFFI